MDPHAVLGIRPGASPEELTAQYRALAKRWHPDRGGGPAAARRMAEVNAAYELLRSSLWQDRDARERLRHADPVRHGAPVPGREGRAASTSAPPRPAGAWLAEPLRRALGPELLRALHRDEPVELIVPTSVWASPQALLAITDRRLLWLLDDAVTGRVRSLAFVAVTGVETRLSWPRRRTATLRVRRRNGRRPLAFGDLRPETAEAIARRIAAGSAPTAIA